MVIFYTSLQQNTIEILVPDRKERMTLEQARELRRKLDEEIMRLDTAKIQKGK